MDKYWVYNTESNRFSKCIEHAQKEAENWASEHIKRPITFLQTSEFTLNENNTALVNFKFPFVYQSNKFLDVLYFKKINRLVIVFQ